MKDYPLNWRSKQSEIDLHNIDRSDNDELIMIGSGRHKHQEDDKVEGSDYESKFLQHSNF